MQAVITLWKSENTHTLIQLLLANFSGTTLHYKAVTKIKYGK